MFTIDTHTQFLHVSCFTERCSCSIVAHAHHFLSCFFFPPLCTTGTTGSFLFPNASPCIVGTTGNFLAYGPAAQLLYTMLPMATELAVHTQGTYVAQKLIFYINSQQELLDVCRAVLPDTVLLLQEPVGAGHRRCSKLIQQVPQHSTTAGAYQQVQHSTTAGAYQQVQHFTTAAAYQQVQHINKAAAYSKRNIPMQG
eukprot:1152339-Pelagomonas_calceolata.AAC.2